MLHPESRLLTDLSRPAASQTKPTMNSGYPALAVAGPPVSQDLCMRRLLLTVANMQPPSWCEMTLVSML